LTKSFTELVRSAAARDPRFAEALVRERGQLLADDVDTEKVTISRVSECTKL
jgi:hypothetical protein